MDLLTFLKDNNKHYSRKELAKEIFCSENVVQKQLNSLKKRDLLTIKIVKVPTGQKMYLYAYKECDDQIKGLIKEYQETKNTNDQTKFFSPESITNMMILKEIRALKEQLANGKQNM